MMVGSTAMYLGPKEIHYLFIDGGCLRTMIEVAAKELFPGQNIAISLDYRALSHSYSKTFYYDAYPPRRKEESDTAYEARIKPVEESFNRLRALDGWHVYEGVSRRRRRTLLQKKVDIMVAVDMLTHTFRGNMHRATLLTNDLDFKPLIDALVQNGMYVTLWYQEGKTNKELIYAADSKWAIDSHRIYSWATPEFRDKFPVQT